MGLAVRTEAEASLGITHPRWKTRQVELARATTVRMAMATETMTMRTEWSERDSEWRLTMEIYDYTRHSRRLYDTISTGCYRRTGILLFIFFWVAV